MSERFETEFSVRSYELDAALDAPPASFLRWFQEAAILASAAHGYDEERYEQLGTAWFMKESHLVISSQPRSGELLSGSHVGRRHNAKSTPIASIRVRFDASDSGSWKRTGA